ncbi:MAG: hypothetical protein OXI57_08620 [Rhodospirillales bacterium]|nr:hypothetical protein [Rhodospirillales bacterium]
MIGTTQLTGAFAGRRQPVAVAALRDALPAAFSSERTVAARRHLELNVQRGMIVVAT